MKDRRSDMFEPKHSNLLRRYATKFDIPRTGDEDARVWTLKCAEQFNFTFPSEGWGTKRASETRPPSTDVICRREDGILIGYDLVFSAGAPNAQLNLHPNPININDQIFITVSRVNHLYSEHLTLLGASLFWCWAGVKKYRTQLERNLEVIKEDLGGDYVRWFFTVGDSPQSDVDPWNDAGAFYDDENHLQICYTIMQLLKSFGLKSHLTLCGGLTSDGHVSRQFNTQSKRDAIIDRAAVLINDFRDDFVQVEKWNEYIVNRAERHWLRDMARRLQAQIPSGFPITLSSPNTIMGGHASSQEVMAEIEAMYGGSSGATELTMHSTRPDYFWNPETLRAIGVNYAIHDGEPRGPGASAGGDVNDPIILGNDYLTCIRGKARSHTLHSMPGVWGGHCNPRFPEKNRWKNIWEVPNWVEIARTLKEIRETGDFESSDPIPGPENDRLLSGQRLLPGQRLYSPNDKYYMEYQVDGNLVVYEKDVQAIWASNSSGQTLGYAEMQVDGNFVLYNQQDPIGATGTWESSVVMAQLQDDGNFVLYRDGQAIWASLTSEWHV